MADSALTLFIPFGAGYGAPGLTLRANTVDELSATIAALSETVVVDDSEVSKLDEVLDGVLTINAGVLLKGLAVERPAAKQTTPSVTHPQAQSVPSSAKTCVHGEMKWKEGVSKAGNNYKGWFCPAPHGQTQCAPAFVK